MRSVLATTALCLSIVGLSVAQDAAGSVRRDVSIPAQGLGPALQSFAHECDLQVIFASDDVLDVRTPGVSGKVTIEEALSQMLRGTGLTYRLLDTNTVTIVPMSAPAPRQEATPAAATSSHAGAAVSIPGHVVRDRLRLAQAEPASSATQVPSNAAPEALEEVVVTGTARASGLHRLDAGFSINSITSDSLQQIVPLSTADVLKNVPGTYVESSGGVAGLRVNVRGFPMNGGGQFSSVELDGTTLLPPMTLSFIEGYSLFRVDDTVERVEVLRGGPSPLFSSGQPGITLNFIQKKGGDVPEGSGRITLGAEGLYRFDGFLGGKLADGWYGTVGGFYRESDGVRDPDFTADKGGQLSATLTRRWDSGEITFSGRAVQDSNIFFSGAPLLSTNNGRDLSVYPFFDQRKDTLAGPDTTRLQFEIGPGAVPSTLSTDFSDGRTIDLKQFGVSFDFNPGEWEITDRFGYLDGTADTRAIFTSAVPLTLGSYINGRIAAVNGSAPVVAAAGGVATSGSARYTTSGTAVTDLSTPVIVAGFWYVDKDIETVSNDFRVSRTFGAHTLTVGNYFAYHSIQDLWYQGNNALLAFEDHARRIDVALNNGVQITKDGFTGYATNHFVDDFDGRNLAFFLADEWEITDRLRIDGGVRYEDYKTDGTVGLASNLNLDGNLLTFYNNSVSVQNGSSRNFAYDDAKTSFTFGANYRFAPELSTFVRVNSGYRFPTFDEVRQGSRVVQEVDQYELGLKTAFDTIDVNLTLFYNEFLGQTYTQQIVDSSTGAITNLVAVAGSEAYGAELDGAWQPLHGLSVGFNFTYFNAEYSGIRNGAPTGVQNGNEVARQPSFQARLSPSYSIPLAIGDLTLFAAYTHVGARYSDIQNLQKLPEYETLDLGIGLKMGAVDLQVTGLNVTNELGLTEGNARIVGTTDAAVIGRSIFGRSYQATAAYRF
ncbi:MAG: TonB-dependent receptor [Pseudomonadota bacterium]|nr:TonB-dependent receptor [Pseudomonadota bacterium]